MLVLQNVPSELEVFCYIGKIQRMFQTKKICGTAFLLINNLILNVTQKCQLEFLVLMSSKKPGFVCRRYKLTF